MLRFLENRLFLAKTFYNYTNMIRVKRNFANKLSSNNRFDYSSAKKSFSLEMIDRDAGATGEKIIYHTIKNYIKVPIKSVRLNDDATVVSLNFDKGRDLRFPVIWLRDNCRCRRCFDTLSNSRIHSPLSFGRDVIPEFVTSTDETLSIVWSDGHESCFQRDWLCRHSFEREHQMERLKEDYVEQIAWNAQDYDAMEGNLCFEFEELMNDDVSLLKWLEKLASVGVTKISGAPLETGQLVKLSRRVSYIRETHYGREYYIRGEKDSNNVAYQKGPLPMHTDLPYYNYVPGVVLLHFVTQSYKGGENILADGLNAVKQLTRKTYDVLAATPVDWLDIGFEKNNKFHSMNRAPVICENLFGLIERINWSQPQRNSEFNVPVERAIEWYQAFQEFSKIIHDGKNAVEIKNSEGNILAFDNRRILHGRYDFEGKRFLCGVYLDWDDIYSRIRVLRQNLTQS